HGFYRLHHPVNRLGCATRLGHARASAHSRRFGRECRLSAARAAEIFWRAFPVLFAVAFRGAGLGRDRELAASESTIQSAVSVLVWIARVRLLFSSLDEPRRDAELGRSVVSRFRITCGLFLERTNRTARRRSFRDG